MVLDLIQVHPPADGPFLYERWHQRSKKSGHEKRVLEIKANKLPEFAARGRADIFYGREKKDCFKNFCFVVIAFENFKADVGTKRMANENHLAVLRNVVGKETHLMFDLVLKSE